MAGVSLVTQDITNVRYWKEGRKEGSILGSIFGYPNFGKLPYQAPRTGTLEGP